MGVHWIDSPSKQSICIGILVLEAPCRSDKLFSAHTQIYFPAHRIIAYIPLFSSLRKGLRNPVFMQLSRLKCAFFIHHFAHFYFLQLIILRVNLIRTNEMWSFSVVNASAPVGTTDKLSDFYLTCLVFHQIPAAHLKMLVITSQSVPLKLHSLFVRNWLFVDLLCNYNNINIFDVFEFYLHLLITYLSSLGNAPTIPIK